MRRIIIIVLTVIMIVSAVSVGYMRLTEEFDTVRPLDSREDCQILSQEQIPRADVSSFLVGEGFLAIYYDDYGLVNVYDLDGGFLYGFQVECIQNGRGDIACEGLMLYVESRNGRMYVFQGSQLVRRFRRDDDPEEYKRITDLMDGPKNVVSGNETYYYLKDTNQVAKTVNGANMVTVIDMPAINPSLEPTVLALLFAIIGLTHYLGNNKSGGRNDG